MGLGASLLSGPEWVEDKRMVRPEQLDGWMRWLRDSPELVVDYESDGLDTRRGARSFMVGAYAPDRGAKVADLRLLGDPGYRAAVDGLSKRTGVTIVHNGKHEVAHSRALGFELGGKLWDNQAASFAEDERGPHGQKDLIETRLKRVPVMSRTIHDWMETNLGTSQRGHELNPNSLEVPYNAEDVTDAWDLYTHFKERAARAGLTDAVFVDSELCRPVVEMETTGLRLDMDLCAELSAQYQTERAAILNKVRGMVGNVDLHSHQELFGLLYGRLGMPMHKDLEKKGKLDEDVLAWMLSLDDIPDTARQVIEGVREYRELDKLDGTYLMPWMYEHSIDGRLYPNLNMTVAGTRRFTADSPNLQNVPTRTDLAKQVRAAFLEDVGCTTYAFDYSQVEYRMYVHYSREPALVKGYRESPSFDVHQMVAEMLGIPRPAAKHINFGIVYGMGIDKLSRKLLLTRGAAKEILERYFTMIPSVKRLKRELADQVKGKGYVRTVYGTRRHLTQDEDYKALNTACQMTAADLLRRALVRVGPVVRAAGGRLKLQVHDEVLFRLPGTDTREHMPVLLAVQEAMERAPEFCVPIRVECQKWVGNWAAKEKVPLAAA